MMTNRLNSTSPLDGGMTRHGRRASSAQWIVFSECLAGTHTVVTLLPVDPVRERGVPPKALPPRLTYEEVFRDFREAAGVAGVPNMTDALLRFYAYIGRDSTVRHITWKDGAAAIITQNHGGRPLTPHFWSLAYEESRVHLESVTGHR